jgi:transcriptional regulator GlxA family with amidase domain
MPERRHTPFALRPADKPVRIGLFVADGFPLAPLSLAIDALRLANWVEGQEIFSYVVVSADGENRASSSHLPAFVNHSVATCPPLQVLLVCTGSNSSHIDDPAVLNWLRRIYRQGSRVGAISGGAFVLAHAGLLHRRTCAIHWEVGMALEAAFPDIEVSGDIFVIDGRIITCAGGTSTLDLMLHLIEHFRSPAIARRVADDLIYPSMRDGHEPARIELRRRTGVTNSVLLGAIEIMERNVEEPVKLAEISAELGTSMRHLERLFARAFGVSPSQYYMQLRLREARGLLAQTDLPLFEVALRCGFQNTSHFARRYRERYNVLPSEERQALL